MCYIILDITYSHQNLVVSAPPAVLSVRNSPVSTIESIHVPPVASSVRRHRLVVSRRHHVVSSSSRCHHVLSSSCRRLVVVSSSSRRCLVVVSSSSRHRLVVVCRCLFVAHHSHRLQRKILNPPLVPRTTLVPLENLIKIITHD